MKKHISRLDLAIIIIILAIIILLTLSHNVATPLPKDNYDVIYDVQQFYYIFIQDTLSFL